MSPPSDACFRLFLALQPVRERREFETDGPVLVKIYNDLLTPEMGPEELLAWLGKQAGRPVPERTRGTGPTAVPRPDFSSQFVELRQPDPDAPPPSRVVVEAVAAFRHAGWFEGTEHYADTDLAARLGSSWWALMSEDLPDAPLDLDWCLVALDGQRSLYADIEADCCEGNRVYEGVLVELARLSGGALSVADPGEDWATTPGQVQLKFKWGRKTVKFSLPDDVDFIDPGVILEVNRILPEDGPRFWFVDNGGQMAIVTRASEAERETLQSVRPVRLSEQPPSWWTEVRPLS